MLGEPSSIEDTAAWKEDGGAGGIIINLIVFTY